MLLLTVLPLGLIVLAAAPHLYRGALDQELQQERGLRDSLAQLAERSAASARPAASARRVDSGQPYLIRAATSGIAAAWLQNHLADTVQARGGEVHQIQVLPQTTDTDPPRITIRLDVSIGNDGLRDLLLDIETRNPLLFVEEMKVQAPQLLDGRPRDTEPPLAVEVKVSGAFAAGR